MSGKLYPSFTVLLVDDETTWLDSLSLSLERNVGVTNIIQCGDSRQVIDIFSRHDVGLVLLDLTMPHLTGQELLRLISEHYPGTEVIVLTGINQLDTAVSCMKLGAYDYFVKTEEAGRIMTGVLHAIRMIEMQRENRQMSDRLLSDALAHPEAFEKIITENKTMRSVFQYIESIALSVQPILITGESGVGKELAAQAIHKLSCPDCPMVSVNVAGLDDSVFADTLFGHVRGAYTGADVPRKGLVEEAGRGTLFLDEIGDLSVSSQVKLLRILHDGEYFPLGSDKPKRSRARIVVATNQDLSAKMAAGQFRKDLYYRLQIHKVHIPSLRERKEDLPLLLAKFLDEAAAELGKKKPTVPKELLPMLETYLFPGNVRELRAMVYDAVTLHRSGVLSIDSFLEAMGLKEYSPAASEASAEYGKIFSGLEVLPKPQEAVNLLIDEALKRAKGNQSIAAHLLGISQSAISKRLRRSGI